MPRPEENLITFTIDGREVQAPENTMLVDAAKHGDVEIPVFCYEPKLGKPVGACRMCLVEIEGIPKLQTGCSTPVKDGMVVHTQTERVQTAQQAVVEFLLINHPLDCPVCDKGGECPLQDITFGWGGGISRFIEPKRHFRKPLELSPLIAIDRERCILCYRCVRFSQEISEDYQLVLLERGAHSYVATFDGHPYVAPFSGNIVELCPVGALTSRPYRFRARPWDIEGAGSVCTLCPAQCNVTFTVRDERVLRVLARDHAGVDDGWLCDKGRFAYQAIHVDERITEPLLRDGGELRPVSLGARAGRGGRRTAPRPGPHRRAGRRQHLQRGGPAARRGCCARAWTLPTSTAPAASTRTRCRRCSIPSSPRPCPTSSSPTPCSCSAPSSSTTRRSSTCACARACAAKASSSPWPRRDPLRWIPTPPSPCVTRRERRSPSSRRSPPRSTAAALSHPAAAEIQALADLLRTGGEDVVIVWGERLLRGDARAAAQALLKIASGSNLRAREGAGLLGIPTQANGRGLLEAGFAPGVGPGFGDAPAGRGAHAIAQAAAGGELAALYLMHVDPLLSLSDRPLWERALERASTVIAHAEFLTDGIREHATVVFPAETHAEKEGTVTHPDGRLQRLRPAIARVGETRAEWSVLADLAARVGFDLGVRTGPMATAQLAAAVPFYGGLTLEELAGHGVRWQERDAAALWPAISLEGEPAPFQAAASSSAARRRRAAARHLPLGVGGAGGARLAGARVPAPPPASGDLPGRCRAPRPARR